MVLPRLGTDSGRAPLSVSPPSVPFSPSLNTTLAWYDAGSPSSVHHTSNAVDTLDDLSGNARHVGNTGTSRPTYNAANGKITFDGSNDYLFHTSAYLFTTGEKAIYAVVNLTAGNYKCVVGEGNTGDEDTAYCPVMTGNAALNDELSPYIAPNSGSVLMLNQTLGGAIVCTGAKKILRVHDDNGLITGWVNGTAGATPRTYTRTGVTLTPNRFALGAKPYTTPAFCPAMELFEIIIAPDDSLSQKYEGYLAHRHGLTSSLPGGHPYKTDPPLQDD